MSDENIYTTPQSDISVEASEDYEYAGFWIRVVAAIIDTILAALLTMPILFAIYGGSYFTGAAAGQGIWNFLISYVLPAVVVIVFWAYKSATPGKMIVGIKIVSLGESPEMSKGQLIGRYLGYYVSMIPLFLGLIWVGIDKRKQGFHDKLANTAVVKDRK